MKLLFIHHGSRVRKSKEGNYYIDTSFNNNIWKRYRSYCDELTAIIRMVPGEFEEAELSKKYNKIDLSLVNLILVEDVYKPKKNFLNLKLRNKVKEKIKAAINSCDKVIIRSAGDFYTEAALKFCKKFKKEYLIEVVSLQFESFWYHGITGKLLALPTEIKFEKAVKNAPYVLYVTNETLQKRYPNYNRTIACSDVEIDHKEKLEDIMKYRKEKLEKQKGKIILGTAANLNGQFKGQQDVVKALYYLKKMGNNRFEYILIGSGDDSKLRSKIKKYKMEDTIKILGTLPHDKVNEWYKSVDLYIQPSYLEGLCRSILEAMSQGCAIICTNVGGNRELINNDYLYRRKKIKSLLKKLLEINNDEILEQSEINYKNSWNYDQTVLDDKRDKFYKEFTEKV